MALQEGRAPRLSFLTGSMQVSCSDVMARTCAECICTNQRRLEALLLVEGSVLCTCCGLTGSLHTNS